MTLSQLPEMKKFARFVAKVEGEYLPSGQPISPLTEELFTTYVAIAYDRTDHGVRFCEQ